MGSFAFNEIYATPESEVLRGKVVLITGASGGIGSATALSLARHGCSFAIHYHSNFERANAVVSKLRKMCPGVRHAAFKADLSCKKDITTLHANVVRDLGPIDVLYVNHGITGPMVGLRGNIEDVDVSVFENTWQHNTLPAFMLSQLCMPHMQLRSWGRIVFCSSVSAGVGGVAGPHYASSKSALHGLMHWIAQRYAKEGITCNVVAPALVMHTGMLPEHRDDYAAHIPVGRLGKPEEIAGIVEMFIKTPYMTNKVITADGGWTGGV